MKRFSTLILSIALAGQAWAQEFESDRLFYKITSTNPNTVEVRTGKTSLTSVIIPDSVHYEGEVYAVTSIYPGAFSNSWMDGSRFNKIDSISIGNCVTHIGGDAFTHCNLKSITIPNSVISIGSGAFSGCGASFSIPASVTSIGMFAFSYNYTTTSSITIRGTVGEGAFENCGVTTVIIDNTTKEIGNYAFNDAKEVISFAEIPPTLGGANPFGVDTIYVKTKAVDAYKEANYWKYHEIVPFGIVSAKSDNEANGTIQGDSILLQDKPITITAMPKDGYHFTGWSDGNKDNPRIFNEAKDTAVVASFEAHTMVTDAAVAPTCIATGLTEGSHCAVCNKKIVEQQIVPIINHSAVIDDAIEPTCTESGLTKGIHCPVCSEVLVPQEYIPAKGHTEIIDEAVAATCTESGLTEGRHCSACNVVFVKQDTIPAKGHTETVDAAIAPTCIESGLTEGCHCSVCNVVLVMQEIVPINPNNHIEVIDAAIEPTCTESGLTEGRHCSACGKVFIAQETIVALGHTEVIDEAIAPECTETGLTEGKHCSTCGKVFVAQEVIEATGHNWEDEWWIQKESTCSTHGTKILYCKNSAHADIQELPLDNDKHENVVTDAAVAPTCTESGLSEGTHCAACGTIFVKQDTISALGHLFANYVHNNDATTAVDGTETATCERGCGATDTRTVGHKFVNYVYNNDATTEADGTETATCERGCGATDTRVKEGTKLATAVSESAANTINIYAIGNTIVVENATEEIRVYNAMGALICRDAINRVRTEIPVNGTGVYIVKIGGVVKRVMVN